MSSFGRFSSLLRRAPLAALLLLVIVPGDSPLRGSVSGTPREDIILSLKQKVIRDLSSSGLTLAFHIAVTNRDSSDRALVRYRYRVVINQREFLNLTVALDEPLSVPAGRETLISLPVKISYPLLFAAVGAVEDKALCDIVGEMVFADERKREGRVGFAFPGEFPIFKDPEIEFLPLKVNDLTVGGADVLFRSRFRNLNRYDLLIERITFHLLLGNQDVLSGPVEGDKSLPPAGEKVFSLPFIIDFFEAGKGVRELFQKTEMPCRFSGEVEILSAWGKLLIHFDKTANLVVEKSS